jgi:hypothetical protein
MALTAVDWLADGRNEELTGDVDSPKLEEELELVVPGLEEEVNASGPAEDVGAEEVGDEVGWWTVSKLVEAVGAKEVEEEVGGGRTEDMGENEYNEAQPTLNPVLNNHSSSEKHGADEKARTTSLRVEQYIREPECIFIPKSKRYQESVRAWPWRNWIFHDTWEDNDFYDHYIRVVGVRCGTRVIHVKKER